MADSLVQQRRHYIERLRQLGDGLRSPHASVVAESRRALAALRQSFVVGKQFQAYEVVFRDGVPDHQAEQELWLLVGGLFALHPLAWPKTERPRSLGASLGELEKKLGNPSIARRFTQLLARDKTTLPHHLRQAIRLLAAHDVPVHHGLLLDDLVILLGDNPRGDRASSVRLKWAREYYYMPVSTETPAESDQPTDLSETQR